MFSVSSSSYSLYITLIVLLMAKVTLGTTFTLVNKCTYTVWPGILANAGSSPLSTTGFQLPPRAARSFQAPPGWSGRFWARTGCSFDPTTGQGTCSTGDCGSNQVECNGLGAAPPATLAEITVGSGDKQDFYDVSLVDGYNIPMIVEPVGGTGACGSTGCVADLNRACPNELRTEDGQGCKSACEAFGSPEYCCSGAYGSPDTCRPSVYSEMFKSVCPRSYSYAYDDATSTFTCSGADYTVTFCPSMTSQKSSTGDSTSSPAANGTPSLPADDGGSTSPAEDDFTSWLPNFVRGSSSPNLVLHSYNVMIICVVTLVSLSSLSLDLQM